MASTHKTLKSVDTDTNLFSTILSYHALDDCMKESIRKLGHAANFVSTDSSVHSESVELDRLTKILNKVKSAKQIDQVIEIVRNTKFQSVKNRLRDFFLTLFLREYGRVPTENYDPEIVILSFSKFFKFFEEDYQEELLDALSSLLVQVHINKTTNFQLFEVIIRSCTSVLLTLFKMNYGTEKIIKFVKSILQNSIEIASTVSSSISNATTVSSYIVAFLPFIAELDQLIENQDVLRLVQQYIIICMMFTVNNTRIFNNFSESLDKIAKFLPALLQRKPKIDFSSTRVGIQELLTLINHKKFQKTEDVLPSFLNLFPNLPAKALMNLDLPDAVYALSIFFLEVIRAERGIVGPILEYIEAEYNKDFTIILDEMFVPILDTFYVYIEEIPDLETKSNCVAFTTKELISKFSSPNELVQKKVDSILNKFITLYPVVCCDKGVLKAITHVMLNKNDLSAARQQLFTKLVTEMFASAIFSAPNNFFAAIFHSQMSDSDLSNMQTVIVPLIELLPEECRKIFMQVFIAKSVSYGQAKFSTPELIKTVPNDFERLLLTSSYLINHHNCETLIRELVKPLNNPYNLTDNFGEEFDEQTTAWCHASMSSVSLSKIIVANLKNAFKETIEGKKGIFGTTVDQNMINYQTRLLHFFIETLTVGKHYSRFFTILYNGIESKILNNSAVFPAVISYALLGCLILNTSYQTSQRLQLELKEFILKLVLIAYSYTYDDYVLKHIKKHDLFILEQLAIILPGTICPPTKASGSGKNKSKDKSKGSHNRSTSISSAHKSNTKVDEAILRSKDKSEINYLETHNKDSGSLEKFSNLVAYMVCDQLQLFYTYLSPGGNFAAIQRILALRQMKANKMHLNKTVKMIWRLAPEALYPFCLMQKNVGQSVLAVIHQLMEKDTYTAPSVPLLSLLYCQPPTMNFKPLALWKTVPANKALALLTAPIMKNNIAAKYVAKCFEGFSKRESLLFLPQLVQSLRFDSLGILKEFLIRYCKNSEVFSHYLLWNILAEKNNPVGTKDNLPKILESLEKKIIKNMNEQEKINYENEFGLIDKLDKVSQKLLPMDIEKRPPALGDMLNEMEIPKGLYIPSNPNYKIISIDSEHSVPLKSHARVPILVHFKVYDEDDEEKKPFHFSCIFKIMDDVRQDAMMIQFIDITKQILVDAGIDAFLFPYRVFTTGTNRGVIECIHGAKSRHDLGVATNEYLLEYFISKYGQVGSPEFVRAQDNFIKSMAPYSLICYLFQVKDRHNANIMLDDDGHIIHIDFGFIFEISPGGNMKFERAPFKLTREMINVMGGSKESPEFQKFVKLLTQCFFAVRARHQELEAITALMMNAGFPCFLQDSIKKLQGRFFLDKSAKETCNEILKLVDSAYEANSTTMYDAFQKAQNDIFF